LPNGKYIEIEQLIDQILNQTDNNNSSSSGASSIKLNNSNSNLNNYKNSEEFSSDFMKNLNDDSFISNLNLDNKLFNTFNTYRQFILTAQLEGKNNKIKGYTDIIKQIFNNYKNDKTGGKRRIRKTKRKNKRSKFISRRKHIGGYLYSTPNKRSSKLNNLSSSTSQTTSNSSNNMSSNLSNLSSSTRKRRINKKLKNKNNNTKSKSKS
jgi:hypothetical protein